MFLHIFRKMRLNIETKLNTKEPGLYIALVFPIVTAFLLTFALARLLNHLAPGLSLQVSPGLHIHHFTYGFFVLAISGYLALIYNGPRGTYLIALLHGFGLGLAMDEFGMWLRLQDDSATRWNYDGFLIVIALFIFILTFKAGLRRVWGLWPRTQKELSLGPAHETKGGGKNP